MKETRIIDRFTEKNYHLGRWAILGPKLVHPHYSGSAGRIFQKYKMKGANRYMRIIRMRIMRTTLIIFLKNNLFGVNKWTILGPKMAHCHNSGSTVRIF